MALARQVSQGERAVAGGGKAGAAEVRVSAEMKIVMPALVAGIHVFSASPKRRHGWPGQAHGCPARFVLEEVHDIDSARFQLVCESSGREKGSTPCSTRISFFMGF
jgi:hypothetical protein